MLIKFKGTNILFAFYDFIFRDVFDVLSNVNINDVKEKKKREGEKYFKCILQVSQL